MKCDKLQYERLGEANWAYPASTLVIRKQFVDEAIAELKAKLESVQASAYAESVDAGMEKQAVLLSKALNTISESHKHVVSLARKCNHANYKRCLAMAKWCASRVVVWATEGNEKKSNLYWKWKDKWRKLAYKNLSGESKYQWLHSRKNQRNENTKGDMARRIRKEMGRN